MNIIWLSEIKWSYLRTRKQQILSRFLAEDMILFIEPISKWQPNRFTLRHDPPIHAITLPHIRLVTNLTVNRLLDKAYVRQGISRISGLWLDILLKLMSFKPDVLVLSNVFWSGNAAILKKRWPELPVVYDCNDNPLGFPRVPAYMRKYVLETIELADLITMPHIAYLPVDPEPYLDKIRIVSNGVDFKHFQQSPAKVPLLSIPRPVIMYVGAISEWFDFDLMKRVADTYPSASVVLIGPIAYTVGEQAQSLIERSNVTYFPAMPHDVIRDYIYAADVCVIPFVANELTRPVIPNKLFEYAAVGKNIVASHFNPDLREFSQWAFISESGDDFLDTLAEALHNPKSPEHLKQMAARYNWESISKEFREHLLSLTTDKSTITENNPD